MRVQYVITTEISDTDSWPPVLSDLDKMGDGFHIFDIPSDVPEKYRYVHGRGMAFEYDWSLKGTQEAVYVDGHILR